MRGKGINYDTGFFPGGSNSRVDFDPETVRREMQIIADDLHCTAVRISGGDAERLSIAARYAADAGLEVWFAPFPCELTPDEMHAFLVDCAERAEAVRTSGAEVVFVAGCEVTLFARGFVPGDDVYARIDNLTKGSPELFARFGEIKAEARRFFAALVADIRKCFHGKVSYAAGEWEEIDWELFDFVGMDAYRYEGNADGYRDLLRRLRGYGKPVAITEFGSCTYTGAAARGGMGWAIIDRGSEGGEEAKRLDGTYERNETEQAAYLAELLEIFEEEGIDSAFWFTFAGYGLVHRPDDPIHDLDMASYGVVKLLENGRGTAYPDLSWEPKESFEVLSRLYRG